ncbi:MAG TPA: hypothetical protein VNC78_11420 [Actinomycetota bacterium]|nr:hypothetical protein [Actinomycetota bacterium]
MPTQDRRLTRLAAVAVSLLVALTPVAIAAPQGPCPRVEKGPFWTSIGAPDFPAGEAAITAYAVDPVRPKRLFATNGTAVMLSEDRGCSWRESVVIPATPERFGYTAATAVIRSIEMPEQKSSQTVLLMVEEVTPEERPHVLRSEDGGSTWATADAGLPPTGSPESLLVAPSDASIAYLAIDVGDGSVDVVYGSADGGASWETRSSPQGAAPGAAIPTPDPANPQPPAVDPGAGVRELMVNPKLSEQVWAYGAGGLYRSDDGARTFAAIDEFTATEVGPLALWHAGDNPPIVVAFRPATQDFLGSPDGGENWLRFPAPFGVQSVAWGPDPMSMAVSANRTIYMYHAASFTWLDVNPPREDILDFTADARRDPFFYGRTSSTLEIYTGPSAGEVVADPPEKEVGIPLIDVPPGLSGGGDPELLPARRRVELRLGQRKTISYSLRVPEERTPLDVYFLIDVSGSMTPTLNALREGIVEIINGLHAANIDVQFGVGSYRAYPDSQVPRVPEPNFVYRRVRDIAPYSPTLQTALASLEADAGGRFESHLSAMYETATGVGEDVYPPGPSSSDVPPGLQANFRGEALRVVVMVADSEFGREEEDRDFTVQDFGRLTSPDFPEFQEVADVLNERDIMQVGLGVGSPMQPPRNKYLTGDYPTTMKDLQWFAQATGALAPPGGVDCNDDGFADIAAGAPLACPLPKKQLNAGGNLVPPIVNLVKAVRDYTSVTVAARRGAAVVADVDPEVYSSVPLQSSGLLEFEVTYSCPVRFAGQTVPVTLEATAGVLDLDAVTATVVCGEDPLFPPLRFDPLVALALAVAPPPLPPVAQGAPAAQGQAQAQFGFVQQKQEQPQLAYVHAGGLAAQQEVAEEYEFSSLAKDRDVAPERTLGAGAALLIFMYGCTVLARGAVFRTQRQRR